MRDLRSRHLAVLGFVWAITSLTVFGGRIEAEVTSGTSQDELALQTVAQRENVPVEALAVVARGQAEYPLQNLAATDYKVEDTRDGTTYRVALLADGTAIDPEEREHQELTLYAQRYGKLDTALSQRLASLPAGESVSVMVWLRAASPSVDRPQLVDDPDARKPTEAEIDQLYQRVDSAWAAAVAEAVGPAAARLEALGYVPETDPYNPVIFASLPADAIYEVNTWPEVQRIYLDVINEPELSSAVPTVLGNVVHGRGINGANVRVGQIEVGGRVAVANPWLAGVVQDGTFVCAAPSGHSTGVAGIIRSTHAVERGVSPGATLWAGGSCGGSSAQLTNRSTAAADWGARALNLSWGANIGLVPGANDRFYDSLVLNRWRTVVKSAGNQAAPCPNGSGNVTSPGLAYNVITVGNFDDRQTGNNWGDDLIGPCSSWRDPASTHNDREKPEVAAPGTDFTSTTTAYPWIGPIGSGTSYAAPMVTGATALLVQRNGFFSVWPETVKALLMVSAVHNIEGATRLSEFDGAGGIALDRADDVAGGVTGGYGGQGYNCATPVNIDVATVWMASGIRTRVAIAWDTDPNYASYNTQPGADLDLRVLNPSGVTVASSLSWDNTYEIVEFVPQQTGFHRIRVNKFRCSFNPQWLGWAWRQGT